MSKYFKQPHNRPRLRTCLVGCADGIVRVGDGMVRLDKVGPRRQNVSSKAGMCVCYCCVTFARNRLCRAARRWTSPPSAAVRLTKLS